MKDIVVVPYVLMLHLLRASSHMYASVVLYYVMRAICRNLDIIFYSLNRNIIRQLHSRTSPKTAPKPSKTTRFQLLLSKPIGIALSILIVPRASPQIHPGITYIRPNISTVMANTSTRDASFNLLGSAKLNTVNGRNPAPNPAPNPASSTTATQHQSAEAQVSAIGGTDKVKPMQKAYDAVAARLQDEERG